MVQVETKKNPNDAIFFSAVLQCPVCPCTRTASKVTSKCGLEQWSLSNFSKHLKESHEEFVSKTRLKKPRTKRVLKCNNQKDKTQDNSDDQVLGKDIDEDIVHQPLNQITNTPSIEPSIIVISDEVLDSAEFNSTSRNDAREDAMDFDKTTDMYPDFDFDIELDVASYEVLLEQQDLVTLNLKFSNTTLSTYSHTNRHQINCLVLHLKIILHSL